MARKITSLNTVKQKFKCFKCEEEKEETEFYSCKNGIYIRIPVCKKCMLEIFEGYLKEYGNGYKALHHICSDFNLYYDKEAVASVIASSIEKEYTASNILGTYMKILSGYKQYFNLNFYNSDLIDNDEKTQMLITTQEEDIGKWGNGFTKDDYKRLNELYAQWASGTPQDTITQISLTKDLCKVDLRIEKKTVQGQDTKVLLDQKQNIIKSLAIDPQTLLKSKQDNEANECFGSWIAEIEKQTPAEYMEKPGMYFDINGIGEYFKKHFIRTIKNLLLGNREYPNITLDDDDDIVGDEDNG